MGQNQFLLLQLLDDADEELFGGSLERVSLTRNLVCFQVTRRTEYLNFIESGLHRHDAADRADSSKASRWTVDAEDAKIPTQRLDGWTMELKRAGSERRLLFRSCR